MELKDYRFIPLNTSERFDRVNIQTVERWKESELSGDEWRFSYTAEFFSHGVFVGTVSGRSIEDVLSTAAADYSRVEDETPGGYYGDLENFCCQPGCNNIWDHLLHPIKRYSKNGEELARPYSENEVRGFCNYHVHRGDAGLDDGDYNYIGVAYRSMEGELLPPDPSAGRKE